MNAEDADDNDEGETDSLLFFPRLAGEADVRMGLSRVGKVDGEEEKEW